MTVTFNKYQGAGNDFVIIDNRKILVKLLAIQFLLTDYATENQHGADGLIVDFRN